MDIKEKPELTEFMDEDMLKLWQKMGPMPGDLRLYGGTALALFLNHRLSTAFDFATPEATVEEDIIETLPWLEGAKYTGGPGMIDAVLIGENRKLAITFMECGRMIPMPTQPPIVASNGVPVAHPVDLVASKMEACVSRGAVRDYEDISEAIKVWPEVCRAAVQIVPNRRVSSIARMISLPPVEVAAKLDKQTTKRLLLFAREVGSNNHGVER